MNLSDYIGGGLGALAPLWIIAAISTKPFTTDNLLGGTIGWVFGIVLIAVVRFTTRRYRIRIERRTP